MTIQRQGGAGFGPGSDSSPESFEPPIEEKEVEETEEELSLLDDPEIEEKCLADLDTVLKDGMENYPAAAEMAKTAPDNFKYLFHELWKDAKDGDDRARTWGVIERLEKEIKDRQ